MPAKDHIRPGAKVRFTDGPLLATGGRASASVGDIGAYRGPHPVEAAAAEGLHIIGLGGHHVPAHRSQFEVVE